MEAEREEPEFLDDESNIDPEAVELPVERACTFEREGDLLITEGDEDLGHEQVGSFCDDVSTQELKWYPELLDIPDVNCEEPWFWLRKRRTIYRSRRRVGT